MSLREKIFNLIKNDPELTNKQLYKQCPGEKEVSIRVYANEFRKLYNTKKKKIITNIKKGKIKKTKITSSLGKL